MTSETTQTTVDAPEAPAAAQPVDGEAAPAGAQPDVSVRPVAFTQLADHPEAPRSPDEASGMPLDLILDVEVPVVVELGHTEMPIQDLLALRPGAVIELDKLAGEPADLVVRGHVVAQGEVIVVDDTFGIRITQILAPSERVKNLR